MTNNTDKKITLYADILKETANENISLMYDGFGLPPEEERQRDLQYIVAVLVSSGMNLNGGVFMPSELIAARDTMLHKPLDIEHIEGYVVGHITDRAFMTKDRKVINPVQFMAELGNKVDKENIDIAVLMSLYKYRFPDTANEVEEGKYKVSMECYYRDFDIKIGDVIISKDEAESIGISSGGEKNMVGKSVNVSAPGKELSTTVIGRVFRDILFSGCGLVEYPANPDSLILDAASEDRSRQELLDGVVIDLSKSETYMKNKQEQEAIEVPIVTVKETSGFGEKLPASSNPGTCVSFKKYKYVYTPEYDTNWDEEHVPHDMQPTGFADTVGPDDKIVGENWCTLFDTECSARPGDATHPSCLRNVLNSTTREAVDGLVDLFVKSEKEGPIWGALSSLQEYNKNVSDFLARAKK